MQYSRIISYLFFLLSASFFVCASPVGAPTANGVAKRGGEPGGNEDDVLAILVDLKAKVDLVIPELNVLSGSGGDPTALLAQISAAVDISVTALLALEPDTSGQYDDDKKKQIQGIFVDIVVNVVVALGKFPFSLAFLTITATVDIFLNNLLLAVDVTIVGIVQVAAVLVTHLDIFVKLKLLLTLGTFGLLAL